LSKGKDTKLDFHEKWSPVTSVFRDRQSDSSLNFDAIASPRVLYQLIQTPELTRVGLTPQTPEMFFVSLIKTKL